MKRASDRRRCRPSPERFEDRLLLSTFTVTSTADNGDDANPLPNSLRDAIERSNASPGGNVIDFALAGVAPSISLESPLPAITEPVSIDGSAVVGGFLQPGVSLIGSDAGPSANGLVLDAGGSSVKGLAIGGFQGEGIIVTGQGGDLIQDDSIGADLTGLFPQGNFDGVRIDGAAGNVLTNDVISGNRGSGVLITGGASDNLVSTCFLGIDANGTSPLGNGIDGVTILGSSGNTIGGTTSDTGDVISANKANGVGIEPLEGVDSTGNVVRGDFIGTDYTGVRSVQLGNLVDGVAVIDSPDNIIGAANVTAPGQSAQSIDANLISGNGGDGVQIIGHPVLLGGLEVGNTASGNSVLGNLIGTDLTGNLVTLGNDLDGIFIDDASDTTIGGTAQGARNVVSGNRRFGIAIAGADALNNLVQGNSIGVSAAGDALLGNSEDGIFIGGGDVDGLDPSQPGSASNNTIGGTTASASNVISGNGLNGVEIAGLGASGNVVQGNFIGTDPAGEDLGPGNSPLTLGNARDGVLISLGSGNLVGGAEPGLGNIISGNDGSGVEVDGATGSSGTGNLIQGNTIGLDKSGTRVVGNLLHGVSLVGASANTVGGTTSGARNFISGNNLTGVNIQGPLADDNLIEGDFIGTDISGTDGTTATSGETLSVGNFAEGVFIIDGSGNTVGGTSAGAGDVISGNRSAGVSINGSPIFDPTGLVVGNDATANQVLGDFIGIDVSGVSPIPNGSDGVLISTASGNTIGGTSAGARNVISNNVGNGVQIFGRPLFDPLDPSRVVGDSGVDNVVQGNDIGTQVSGGGAAGNRGSGVLIFSGDDNLIGGASPGAGNVISGNVGSGVEVSGGAFPDPTTGLNTTATRNAILGNRIGTTGDGDGALGNGLDGVTIDVGAVANSVGGQAAGSGNVISANFAGGVAIIQADNPGVTDNLIQGNFIGTDATGEAIIGADGKPLGNIGDGILLSNSASNTVDFNVIAGNTVGGVDLAGGGASGNLVYGNLIGTDAAGLVALGNVNNGVLVDGAPGNVLGLPDVLDSSGKIVAPLLGNLISGNLGIGVLFLGAGATGNVLQGSLIGTDLSGLRALPNQLQGVLIENASGNTIGGLAPGERDVISANRAAGVQVLASGQSIASGNQILGDDIGTDETGGDSLGPIGVHPGNAGDGVLLQGASQTVLDGDLISSNAGSGVHVVGGSGNRLMSDLIGTDASGFEALGNAGNGVFLEDTEANTIGGFEAGSRDVISGNTGEGVAITGAGATGNGIIDDYIGPNVTGEHAVYDLGPDGIFGTADDRLVGNGLDGVLLQGAGPGNAVFGDVISANLGVGLEIAGATTDTLVEMNVIGLDALGASALGNVYGIYLNDAVGNTIGGTSPGAGNVISGNSGPGIAIGRVSVSPSGDAIEGNLIGTDALGTSVPSGAPQPIGIFIESAPDNTIGGTTPGSRNVISGNTTAGISIFGQFIGANPDNVIEGDLIGTTVAGVPLLGPGRLILQGVGVAINTSAGNIVGGLDPSDRDVISGNAVGVEIAGVIEMLSNPTVGNMVVGDTIDTNGFGVYINGSRGNAILGDDLSANTRIGVSIVGPSATGNIVQLDSIVGNFQEGIYIEAASGNSPGNTPNQIKDDVIATNHFVGVYLARGASGNLVESDTIRGDSQQQYGVLLFNSAGNIADVVRAGPDALKFSGNTIADFREYTGPVTSNSTTATLTTLDLSPTSSTPTLPTPTPKGPIKPKAKRSK